jgi:hypothetical protein
MEENSTFRSDIFILFFISLLFLGCSSKKFVDEDKLMKKMIYNYSKTEYYNNYNVYEINKFKIYKNVEIFSFMSTENVYTPVLCDTIGGKSYMLPTNYKKYKGNVKNHI